MTSRAAALAVSLLVLVACGEEPQAQPRRTRVQELALPSDADREAGEKFREAEAFVAARKPKLAEPLLERVLELRPADRPALELLARCRIERGKLDEAVPLLRRARETPGRNAAARALLVRTLMQLGHFEEAEKEARAWTEVDAQAVDSWFDLGRCLYQLGRAEDAIQAFRRAEALKSSRADVRSELGLALAAAGRLAEAEEKQRDAIDRERDSADAWFRLGDVIFRRDPKRVREAVEAMEEAIRRDERMVVAHLYLFRVCRLARPAEGDPLRARGERAWREVLRLHDRAQVTPALGGDVRADPAANEVALREQVALRPSEPGPHAALARHLLAERRHDEAAAAFREAVAAGATDVRTRLLFAATLVTAAQSPAARPAQAQRSAEDLLREAETQCRAVLAEFPEDTSTNRLLAWVLLLQGRDAEAMAAADRAVAGAPDDVLAKKVRALARMHSGEVDEGLHDLAALGWL